MSAKSASFKLENMAASAVKFNSDFADNVNMNDSCPGDVGGRHVKKKKKLVKIRKASSINKSRSINASLNSTLVKASLRSNNRALARALECKKMEVYEAQQTILQLREREQDIMLELTTLREVAGLKNEHIDSQVNLRMEKRMAALHVVLQKVFVSQVEFVEQLTNVMEICGRPRRESSVKTAMMPPKLANTVSLSRPKKPMRVLVTEQKEDETSMNEPETPEKDPAPPPMPAATTPAPVSAPPFSSQPLLDNLGPLPMSSNMPELCALPPDLSMIVEQSFFVDIPFTDDVEEVKKNSPQNIQEESSSNSDTDASGHSVRRSRQQQHRDRQQSLDHVKSAEPEADQPIQRRTRSRSRSRLSTTKSKPDNVEPGVTGRSRHRSRQYTSDSEDLNSAGPILTDNEDMNSKDASPDDVLPSESETANLEEIIVTPKPPTAEGDIEEKVRGRKKSKQPEVEMTDEEEDVKGRASRKKLKGKSLALRKSKRSIQKPVTYSEDENDISEKPAQDQEPTPEKLDVVKPAEHEESPFLPKFIPLLDNKKRTASGKKINTSSKKSSKPEESSEKTTEVSEEVDTSANRRLTYVATPKPEASPAVDKRVSRNRRGTFVLPAADVLMTPELEPEPVKLTKQKQERRGTYCVPQPVTDHIEVEDIMKQDDSILVNLSLDESCVEPADGMIMEVMDDPSFLEDFMAPPEDDEVAESNKIQETFVVEQSKTSKFNDFKVPMLPRSTTPPVAEVTLCEEEDMELTATVNFVDSEKIPIPSFIRHSGEDEPAFLKNIPADVKSTETPVKSASPEQKTEDPPKIAVEQPETVSTESDDKSDSEKSTATKSKKSKLPFMKKTSKLVKKDKVVKEPKQSKSRSRTRTKSLTRAVDKAEAVNKAETQEDKEKDLQSDTESVSGSQSESEGEKIRQKFAAYVTKPGKISFTAGRRNIEDMIKNHVDAKSRSKSRSTLPVVSNSKPRSKGKARSKTRLLKETDTMLSSDSDSVFDFASPRSRQKKKKSENFDISLSDSVDGPKPSYSQFCGREMPHPKPKVLQPETVAEELVTDSPHGIMIVLGNGKRTKPRDKTRTRSKSVRYAKRLTDTRITSVDADTPPAKETTEGHNSNPDVTPPRVGSDAGQSNCMSEDAGNTPVRRSIHKSPICPQQNSPKLPSKQAASLKESNFCVPESPFVAENKSVGGKGSGILSVGDSDCSPEKEELIQEDSPINPGRRKRSRLILESSDYDHPQSVSGSPPIKKKKCSGKTLSVPKPSTPVQKSPSRSKTVVAHTPEKSSKSQSPVRKSLVTSPVNSKPVNRSPKHIKDKSKLKTSKSKSHIQEKVTKERVKEKIREKVKESQERCPISIKSEPVSPTSDVSEDRYTPDQQMSPLSPPHKKSRSELKSERQSRSPEKSSSNASKDIQRSKSTGVSGNKKLPVDGGRSKSTGPSRVQEVQEDPHSQLDNQDTGASEELAPRRRRAGAVSYKEPSLGGKLRRGDANTSSIYAGRDAPKITKSAKDILKAKKKSLQRKSSIMMVVKDKDSRKSSDNKKRCALSTISNTIDSDST